MRELKNTLKRLEDHAPQLDGPALIAPSEKGFGLHLGKLHKEDFTTMEAAEAFLAELRRKGRTKCETTIIWDLADNYREGREKDAE